MMSAERTRPGRRASRDEVRDEFERFVASSAAGLLRLAYLVVWDLAAAEDLVQECYSRVARRWPRVRTMERPVAYTRRILVNLAVDEVSRSRRRSGELDRRLDHSDPPPPAVDTGLAEVDLRHELLGALGELAPRQRAVLVLRYFADLTEGQTAELLGCSVGTVKSTASRALERLRVHYDALPHEHGHPRPRAKATDHAALRT